MAHAKVLLKRPWRTPFGRFNKMANGEPTLIPEQVLNKHSLPRDAVRVDDDYIPPSRRDDDEENVGVTAAQQEAEIHRRVNERLKQMEEQWAQQKNERTADLAEKAMEADLLDSTIAEITEALGAMDRKELLSLLKREKEGKTRKGVVLAIEAALEDAGE